MAVSWGSSLSSESNLLSKAKLLSASYARARELVAADFAPEFNVLEFFGHRETLLSKVLAWMLDPKGTHGQKDVYLQLFLAAFPPQDDKWRWEQAWTRGARVRTEVATLGGNGEGGGRYIDILIEAPDSVAAIAIENKPFANWQTKQLRDYLDDTRRRSKPNSRIIALLGWGSDPQHEVNTHFGPDAIMEDVLGYSFADVGRWIECCIKQTKAPSVIQFLSQFADFIRARFSGVRMSDAQKITMAGIVKADVETFNAARSVSAALLEAKALLIKDLTEAFQAEAAKRGWIVLKDRPAWVNPSTVNSGLSLSLDNSRTWCIVLAFGETDLGAPYIGVQPLEAYSANPPNMIVCKPRFDEAFGEPGGKADGRWWIWWKHLPIDEVGGAWNSIIDGSLIKSYFERADALKGINQ